MSAAVSLEDHDLEETTRSGKCDLQSCAGEKEVVVQDLQRGKMHVCLLHGFEINRVTQNSINLGADE